MEPSQSSNRLFVRSTPRTKGEALAITTSKAGDDKTRLGTTIDEAFKPAQPAETEAEVATAAVAEVTDEAAAPQWPRRKTLNSRL